LFSELKGEYSAAFDYLKALIYTQMDNNKDAQVNFKKALKKLPTFYHAHLAMVKINFDNQLSKKALVHLMEIIKLGRADGNIWKSVAQCHLDTNNAEAAWYAIQQARVFLPNDEHLDKVILNIRIEQEKYPEVISLLKNMLSKKPQERQLWMSLIHAYIQSDKHQDALQNLEIFSRLFKMTASEELTLADLYFNAGFPKDAAKHYLVLAQQKDISNQSLLRCARGLISSNQSNQALTILNMERNIKWSTVLKEQLHILRGEIYKEQNKTKQALLEFNNVLKYNSLNARALYFIADIHQKNKHYDKALNFYSRAQKDRTYTVAALLNSARIYLLKKQYGMAEKTAHQAVDLDDSASTKNFYNQIKAFAKAG
ncbi:MAG: tetratricopeptide repeat protein, partial [Lentisphaeraceae bacterium]|nr:tetratricopeptide repeat protein [Lentisphaeraceae bacterium]